MEQSTHPAQPSGHLRAPAKAQEPENHQEVRRNTSVRHGDEKEREKVKDIPESRCHIILATLRSQNRHLHKNLRISTCALCCRPRPNLWGSLEGGTRGLASGTGHPGFWQEPSQILERTIPASRLKWASK